MKIDGRSIPSLSDFWIDTDTKCDKKIYSQVEFNRDGSVVTPTCWSLNPIEINFRWVKKMFIFTPVWLLSDWHTKSNMSHSVEGLKTKVSRHVGLNFRAIFKIFEAIGFNFDHGITFDHFRSLWRHFKKTLKIMNFVFLVSELYPGNGYALIVKSFVYAWKWWIVWPFSHYEIDNDQFDHFIGKFI